MISEEYNTLQNEFVTQIFSKLPQLPSRALKFVFKIVRIIELFPHYRS